MKQHEAVFYVMKNNGGFATLGFLYQEVLKVPGVKWNTKIPFKSINRIVQTHHEFFKIRPGLWALEEYRNRLPKDLSANSDSPHEVESQHSYYQGLLVEIGNWRKQATFVPAQDRKRKFLDTQLTDIATLHEIYQFGYPHLVKRASTIDVLWFNERNMPSAAYEIEHSTDIQNSLLKYADLLDYNMKFFIVADSSRRGEFDRKILYQAFKPIQGRVKFISYENAADWHTKTAAINAVENVIGF